MIAVDWFDTLDSTMAEASRRVAEGERGPVWIAARRQTAGRGRAGRAWQSDPGNLAATLILSPACAAADLPQLGLVAGLAVGDAVNTVMSMPARERSARQLDVRLKWPNDVLIDGRKVCGILVESTSMGAVTVAAVGIGVNIAHAPALEDGRSAIALFDCGVDIQPAAFLEILDRAVLSALSAWDDGAGFAGIRQRWLDASLPIGTAMSVNAGNGPIQGRFAGLDGDGALLLRDAADSVARFTFGDVLLGGGTQMMENE